MVKLFGNLKTNALHRALGVKAGKKLTAAQETIKPGDSPLMKKRKTFAKNARSFKH